MMRTPRRQRAYDLTNGRCTYCRARLVEDDAVVPYGNDSFVAPEGTTFLCVALMKPRSAGGRGTADNEVPACHRCSSMKGRMDHDAFMSKIGRADGPTPPPREDDTWVRLGEALSAAILGSLASTTTSARGVRTAPSGRSF